MAFAKITDLERQGKGNVGQPDTPLMSTTEMQEQMDSLPNLAIDKFNEFIDEISSDNAATNIGAVVPTGYTASENLQSIIDAVALETKQAINTKHSHPNKTLLDSLSDQTFTDINALILLFANITAIDNTVSSDTDKIPNSLAVKNFVDNYDLKAKIRDTIYPVGAVYVTTLLAPDSVFGTTGKWELVKTDGSLKYYKRIG